MERTVAEQECSAGAHETLVVCLRTAVYRVTEGLLLLCASGENVQERIYVPDAGALRLLVLQAIHYSPRT